MKKIKLIILLLLLIINITISPRIKIKRLPLIINSQKKVFNQIATDIKNQLPKNIEILVFNIDLINGSSEQKELLNNYFLGILKSKQKSYNYHVEFETDIINKNKEINLEEIKKSSELEMLELGNYLEMDAVMLTSISIIDKMEKKVINKNKSVQSKQIGLIQGNIFSSRNNNSLYRFSYYFLLN